VHILPGKSATATGDSVILLLSATKAREHVENVHLRHLNAHDPLDCPLRGKVLEGITRFQKTMPHPVHNCFLQA
jgi:hypothetical protein